MQVENREAGQAAEDASRTLYGMDGPRRRPRPEERVAVPSDAEGARLGPAVARSTVRDRWREESRDHVLERNREQEGSGLEERFAALRVDMETELGRRTDAAVGRLQATFEQEIEALRTANREEAKRLRSANGEAFVRIRASDAQELQRIRGAIDEGIERLCVIIEGQLERVWSTNDVELERIRSAGADRLAEVHDLLLHELQRVREQTREQTSEPARRWFRRKQLTSAD
jgi:hypothetical protein